MKKFFKKLATEFKEFISRGNALDLAVGMIIGSAFTAIVTSFVQDLFTPLIGLVIPNENGFATLNIQGGPQFGNFINAILTFFLTALCLFIVVKAINGLKSIGKKKTEEPAAPTTKICPFCKSEIDINATRCPHCTSELPAEDDKAAAAKEE